jgi:hypothetical protein
MHGQLCSSESALAQFLGQTSNTEATATEIVASSIGWILRGAETRLNNSQERSQPVVESQNVERDLVNVTLV